MNMNDIISPWMLATSNSEVTVLGLLNDQPILLENVNDISIHTVSLNNGKTYILGHCDRNLVLKMTGDFREAMYYSGALDEIIP